MVSIISESLNHQDLLIACKTNTLKPGEKDAPGIGLIQDGSIRFRQAHTIFTLSIEIQVIDTRPLFY
jgi:hypothetical protein